MQSFDKNYKRLDCDHNLSLKCRMKSKIKFNHCLHKNKFTFRKAKPTKNSENWLCFKRHRCLSDGSWIYLHRYVSYMVSACLWNVLCVLLSQMSDAMFHHRCRVCFRLVTNTTMSSHSSWTCCIGLRKSTALFTDHWSLKRRD